ncbi:MAG: alpha/beta fold hydrolase [Oscillospiraceae bacterium]|nr:alpha/beta fold hydrolase [Oscillospiraceae bacterium]
MKKNSFSCKRDNLTIRGHVWGVPEHSRHAVILSHGFLANERMCWKYAKLLADMGYLAVTFDFCSGGVICGSDGDSRDMTVLTEAADLKAVVAAVREQFQISSLSLLGCSQGGFVSAMVAAELGKDTVSRLILFYPAMCIPDDARKGKMMFYKFDPENIPEILGNKPMKLGGSYARAVIGMDAYKEVSGYDGAVLLIHGSSDRVVNVSYSRRLKDLYKNCSYIEIENAGHGFKGKYDQQACDALRSFMGSNEEGSGQAAGA